MSIAQQSMSDQQTPDDFIDAAAATLYEAERAAHPSRNLPPWDRANRVLRADARYRAIAAYLRSISSIKAVLVEVLAQTLATADGVIWPACEARTRQIMPPLEYAATVAQRRQGYRHKARLVLAAHDRYLDVDAIAQPEGHRVNLLAHAKQQQADDVATVQTWRQSIGSVPLSEAPTGEGRF